MGTLLVRVFRREHQGSLESGFFCDSRLGMRRASRFLFLFCRRRDLDGPGSGADGGVVVPSGLTR